MTEPEEFDSLEAALEDYRRNRAPRDIVAGKGLTREGVFALNEMAGKTVTVNNPGKPIPNPDGIVPLGMTESTTTEAHMSKPIISKVDADRLGITPQEVPYVRIV